MDANKLKVLQDIGYTIRANCGLCKSSNISPDGWGYCHKHKYKHKKHSEEESSLSVHDSGYCEDFDMCETKVAIQGLHHFREFIK